MKKKRVAALVMAAILGVTGFSVPGIGVVQAEEAHTEMSGETEQQEINLAADRGSTARASRRTRRRGWRRRNGWCPQASRTCPASP